MGFILLVVLAIIILRGILENKYKKFENEVLAELGFSDWNMVSFYDVEVTVKSRQALEKYDDVKYFKENREELTRAYQGIAKKTRVTEILTNFLNNNEYKRDSKYRRLEKQINAVLDNARNYRVHVQYITSAGNRLADKILQMNVQSLKKFSQDPSLLMGKTEYNRFLKEQQKDALDKKHHEFYGRVNAVIDLANENRDKLVVKGSKDLLDKLVTQLFDRTVNSIKKIKTIDSEEWKIIGDFIAHIEKECEKVVSLNRKILDYYASADFLKIKEICETLMSSQREFNEYIAEKVQSISSLFGTRVVRNETVNEDEYSYIRPYKKAITPFTAEVSATVFASAENNPMEYVVKNFYPNKKMYPEQLQRLRLLLEELETLREAKQIIENYKADYQQYLGDVPAFIMENDEAGFYSRLGFAVIDESVLTVEYKFSYTSGGGMAQRSFTVPMTEETIVELIKTLESKLTASAFAKEQRALMTKKLREFIKTRDNYTCCTCGNSTHVEPNLLLEIDHIIPVSKGGQTEEANLQTLCWKCNRAKSNKILP
jgi:hypothetical protein